MHLDAQDDLKYEILALVEWAGLLHDDDNQDEACVRQFCTFIVPLVESWAILSHNPPGGSGEDSTTATGTGAGGQTTAAQPAPTVPKLGRKLRNKEAHTLSMYQLAMAKATGKVCPFKELLDTAEQCCFEMIGAFSVAVTVEQVLSKDTLLTLAGQVRMALEKLSLGPYGMELLHRSNLKSIEKFTYSSGRQRTSRIKYVDYNPSSGAADDQSGMFHEYATSGKHLNLSTNVAGPGLIAWNKIRRPVEEPLLTAATRFSAQAGKLARQLLDQPDNLSVVNAFYTEVLRGLDPTKPNGTIELQLPLGRLAIAAPDCLAGQMFAGHDHAMQRKHYLALDKYFMAFCLDPEQPLTSLTIGALTQK